MDHAGDLLTVLRDQFAEVIVDHIDLELIGVPVMSLCELVVVEQQPWLIVGMRIPSVEIGKTLLATALIPFTEASTDVFRQVIHPLTDGLRQLRAQAMDVVARGSLS